MDEISDHVIDSMVRMEKSQLLKIDYLYQTLQSAVDTVSRLHSEDA